MNVDVSQIIQVSILAVIAVAALFVAVVIWANR